MAKLDDISQAIGQLQAQVSGVSAQVSDLEKHVNHERDLMLDRLGALEHDQTQRKARSRLVFATGTATVAVITILVLALAVPWHHIGG